MADKDASNSLVAPHLRLQFYKDGYRKWVAIGLAACYVAAASVSLNVIQFWFRPDPKYFATTMEGRIVPLVPLDQPTVNQDTVLSFAQRVALSSFVFDFANYQGQLGALSRSYTSRGYDTLISSLQKNGVLDLVKAKRYVATAVATSAPVVTWSGVDRGVFKWRVEMPVTITLQGQTERKDVAVTLILMVERVPTVDAPDGILAGQMVTVPKN
jgi:intracellular multiplication protein IcmL